MEFVGSIVVPKQTDTHDPREGGSHVGFSRGDRVSPDEDDNVSNSLARNHDGRPK